MVVSPSISGISMSRVMTSGFSSATFCKARMPLAAKPTTSNSGSSLKAWVMNRRITTESSTTRIRILRGVTAEAVIAIPGAGKTAL
jgi:hypothetical protein